VLWARTAAAATVSLPALAPQGRLIDQTGAERIIEPVNGLYSFTLPGARCADEYAGCIIGGTTYLLVENEEGQAAELPTPTPDEANMLADALTPAATVELPLPTATPTPTPTGTPVPSPTATPTPTPTATPTPTPTSTHTPTPTPSATPMPAVIASLTPTPTRVPFILTQGAPACPVVAVVVFTILAATLGTLYTYRYDM